MRALILIRTLVYATVFVGVLLVLLPARVLSWAGVVPPATIQAPQIAGIVLAIAGGALTLWCVLCFALLGRGTPAPFDPPRRLVVRGPYRFLRNPMYLGAGLAVAGAGIFYKSLALIGYAALFLLFFHLFAIWVEEPALRRQFGAEYEAYSRRVRRWRPGRRATGAQRPEPGRPGVGP
jgi:protein-S-isoprenylcysteine O-methyltransferase Ste14